METKTARNGAQLPFESVIYARQSEYYKALRAADRLGHGG